MKLKNAFSVENVKSISDKIHCYGKYANSDRESDESNHCQPGYGVNSSFSNESRSKKRKEKKPLSKKLQMQNIQEYLW